MISARRFVLGAFTLLSAWPAAAGAQERRPESRPRIYIGGDPEVVRDRIKLVTQRRARLGVTVDLEANANDSIGATIESVTPGGPAAKAGIRSGDIITQIDGESLVSKDGIKGGKDESLPGLRLVEIAARLQPNTSIKVAYRRERSIGVATLVTGDEPITAFEYPEWTGRAAEIERMLPRSGAGGARFEFGPGGSGFAYAFGGPLMHLELAPLNAELGQYFGTTEGVLVIDVPKESTLGLQGGDVILSVDGRKATGPGSLLRILRSYDPGDSFKLDIMRNKSRMTVTGKLEKPKEE